ncbi:MAG TPA: biliverdin-producing heme oxygenase [Longimicrobium sp.]|jgi:heme oxygenase|uniref:biliverdin-producing heme oxygenase n=1 Tax=Longimicrobium sp. TaxID=2029185 RepID=UPI002EDB3099
MLSSLKAATAAHHARVEAAMPSLDQLATVEGYASALRALHGFHTTWEPAIWRAPGIGDAGLALAECRKLPLLERDLRALGIEAVTHGPAAGEFPDAATALGALYVLEGATLGGRIIHRHVAGPLGITPERGGAYYHGYGELTGPRWKEFCAAVQAYVARHGGEQHAVHGAVSCFAALQDWLAVPGVLAPAPTAALLS